MKVIWTAITPFGTSQEQDEFETLQEVSDFIKGAERLVSLTGVKMVVERIDADWDELAVEWLNREVQLQHKLEAGAPMQELEVLSKTQGALMQKLLADYENSNVSYLMLMVAAAESRLELFEKRRLENG